MSTRKRRMSPREYGKREDLLIEVTVNAKTDDAEGSFSTPTEFVRAAFDKVLEKVEVESDIKERLFEAYLSAHQAGSPHEERKAVTAHLVGTKWRWSWLDEWIDRFNFENEWPPSFFPYREFLEKRNSYRVAPTNVSESLYLFTVKELRAWLKENEIKVRPCRKRQELEVAMIEAVPWERFCDVALEQYQRNEATRRATFNEKKEEARCNLLTHTITALAYQLRRRSPSREIEGWTWIIQPDDTSFARAAAKNFNEGQSETFPPYYPGDGSYIKHVRKEKMGKELQ
ncbi:conserved hypothetical protein [delta proteobacterium NaphS2]|nr:conserved hypothetical protein [delta proteobacterium NaphS2]